jgi:hypothetical protein
MKLHRSQVNFWTALLPAVYTVSRCRNMSAVVSLLAMASLDALPSGPFSLILQHLGWGHAVRSLRLACRSTCVAVDANTKMLTLGDSMPLGQDTPSGLAERFSSVTAVHVVYPPAAAALLERNLDLAGRLLQLIFRHVVQGLCAILTALPSACLSHATPSTC